MSVPESFAPPCPVSAALGYWRGRRGRPRDVRLAVGISTCSYQWGYSAGRHSVRFDEIVRRVMDDPDPLFDPSDFIAP